MGASRERSREWANTGRLRVLILGLVVGGAAGCAAVAGSGVSRIPVPVDEGGKGPELGSDPQQTRGRDEALYLKGVALQERAIELRQQSRAAGRSNDTEADRLMREARMAYRDLIKNYPTSRRVPHVYVAFGDYYFNETQMEPAQQFYERATRFADSEIYAYAVYKLAWCHINLGDNREALSQFVRLLQHAGNNPGDAQAARLASQARRDLIHPYAQVGSPTRAQAFFQRIAAGHEQEMLARLAEVYRANGQENEAQAVENSSRPRRPSVGYGTPRTP